MFPYQIAKKPRHAWLHWALKITFLLLILVFLLAQSNMPPGDEIDRARVFTRSIEFDYITWIFNALGTKFGQAALETNSYLSLQSRSQQVKDYLELLKQINQVDEQIRRTFADPTTVNPLQQTSALRLKLDGLKTRRADLEPLAESILQAQVSLAAAQLGLTLAGQPIPPVLYRTTPPPDALIISPRNIIRQDADISILPGLPIEQITSLESNVDKSLNVSSLVVGIGGIGLYPTMVMQTTDLSWLSEVVAHEWTHNYLTWHPLGASYEASPELRTMNETAASISGKEIAHQVIEQFYPEFLPPPQATNPAPSTPNEPPAFDFNKEMHQTRVTVDQLLKEGKIDEAETYMEQRRQFMWDHGYQIRKINQAFFAFYGAYADQPVGAAGEDPVGAAVRTLRSRSSSLAQFLNRIAWMWNYEQLRETVNGP